ncbi:MAG: autotransporter-associated beta strand repeat-containing protein [Akkermansiaceae bacterium]|nr:autotransporter-associated beta strand repeat-containing protein [Akkermansiaceae bacterium]
MKSIVLPTLGLLTVSLSAQRVMEDLGRGVVAMRTGSGSTYVSWRMLGSDPDDIRFNLYRSVGGGTPLKLNANPLATTTDFQDSPGTTALNAGISYHVRPVIGNIEQAASASWSLAPNPPTQRWFDLPFSTDPGADGPYDTKFAWVGDFDGDGEYDILCDRLSTLGGDGYVQYLEAYLRNGTLLWRMNMGPNSTSQADIYRPGSSAISTGDGDNVTCFDINGDGRAEAIVRTAHGVTVTQPAGQTVASITASNNNSQFLSVIDGMSGAEIARAPVPNAWAQHGPLQSKCFIAYLDGKRPSVVLYGYNRATNGTFYRQWTAWDWVGGQLSQRWTWTQNTATQPGSEGHQVRIADVDNDGRDEIVDIGHVMDDNGTQLYVTELTHGDRFHVTDMNPDWPGMEMFAIQQNNSTYLATAYLDAATGAFHRKWYASEVVDVGRGIAADIMPGIRGLEMFSTQPNVYDARGEIALGNHPFPYEGLWWDGDSGREFIAGANGTGSSTIIDKFNPATGGNTRLLSPYNDNVHSAFGGRPAFWGDILGDWREEIVLVRNDYAGLRIYTTTTPAQDRRRTLMHNAQYRVQTTTKGYVQASYVDYYLGFETTEDPPQPIQDTDHLWTTGPVLDSSICPSGQSILFDLSGNASQAVQLSGNLSPSRIKVFAPQDYLFDGSSGSLTGSMSLLKSGRGKLTLTGSHSFTGATQVWDGELVVQGTLSASPVTVHGGTWGGPLARGETGGRLAGTGTLAAPVTLAWRGTLGAGDATTPIGTLHLDAGLTCGEDSSLIFDLTSPQASDLLDITGNLTLQHPTTLILRSSSGAIPPGTYTLIHYTGTFVGSLDDFIVDLPSGTPHTLSHSGNSIQITIPVTRAPSSILWRGDSQQNAWDLFQTHNFDLSGTPTPFVSGDHVVFDDSSLPNTQVQLQGDLSSASVTVDSSLDFTFTGSGILSGNGGITKSGSGSLTIEGSHTFTGPVTLQGGTLITRSLADAGMPSSLGAGLASPTHCVLNGGTLRHTGPASSTNRGIRLESHGGTIDLPAASVQISGTINGPGQLRKTGNGLLILGSPNSYVGGTLLAGGTLQLASDEASASGLGSGPVIFDGGVLSMTDNSSSYNSASYPLVVPAGNNGELRADSRVYLGGSLTGSGDFTLFVPFVRTDLRGDWSAFSGNLYATTDADGGDFRIDNTAGYAACTLHLGAGISAYYLTAMPSNITLPIGALAGDSSATLRGGPTAGRTLTWRIGGNGRDATYHGSVVNGASNTAIIKAGPGIQTFTGNLSHSGLTDVTAGTLRLDGTSTTSAFTLRAGAFLGGSGSLIGNLTLEPDSGLELSTTPIAITGNVSASGSIAIRPRVTLPPGEHIVATYSGSLTGNPPFRWDGPTPAPTSITASAGSIRVVIPEPPPDADLDLIPDDWEILHYPDPSSAGPLDDSDGDGYNTWLEWKSGTDPTDPASNPGAPVTNTTLFEASADTFVFKREGNYAYNSSNFGTAPELDLYQNGSLIHALSYLRFDLASLPPSAVISQATLTLTKVGNTNEGVHEARNDNLTSGRFGVWGLLDASGNTPQDWSETQLSASTIGAEITGGANPQVDTSLPRAVSFDGPGEAVSGTGLGSTAAISGSTGSALVSFLQGRIDAGAHPGLATFLVDFPENTSSGRGFAFGSREATAGNRPLLELQYLTIPSPPVEDADGNGLADAWEAHHFSALGIVATGDADADGTPEWLEQALNLDPRDPGSRFHLRYRIQPGGLLLEWDNGADVDFEIQSSENPAAAWNAEVTIPGSASPSVAQHFIPFSGTRKFFRIVATPR